jgi:hypothetical protein
MGAGCCSVAVKNQKTIKTKTLSSSRSSALTCISTNNSQRQTIKQNLSDDEDGEHLNDSSQSRGGKTGKS